MMIQDIEPHHLNNQYDPTIRPAAEDRVMLLSGPKLRARFGETIDFPKARELPEGCAEELIYLFSVDEERYFLWPGEDMELQDAPLCDLKQIR